MQSQEWALGAARATVEVLNRVGVVRVVGVVTARMLEVLHARVAAWRRDAQLLGCVVWFRRETLFDVSDEQSAESVLRVMRDERMAPVGIVVGDAALDWAADHCLTLTRHGLPHAAFRDLLVALAWVRDEAATLRELLGSPVGRSS